MNHLEHLKENKLFLEKRFELLKLTRQFFWSRDCREVETPLLLAHPGQEPYLHPMNVELHDDRGKTFNGFLHTSPEYTLKKLLASTSDEHRPPDYFSIAKCFRDYESFGGTHNPEFTMIEWYRRGVKDVFCLAEDVKDLLTFLEEGLERKYKTKSRGLSQTFRILSMKDLWFHTLKINLDDYLDVSSIRSLCREKGYSVTDEESYEDLFYRIFLSEIESTFEEGQVIFLHTYPAQMAALSKLCIDTRYAQRAEIYVGKIELANGFFELTDHKEQLRRFQEEQEQRKKLGKSVHDIDMDFIDALKEIHSREDKKWGEIAGIALGFDRLVMALLSCKNIDNVLILPASVLFEPDTC